MKAVLISINKPHTDNIKALIKRIEVRKNKPNCALPFLAYIYETKNKGGCGKVIGEFVCNRIEQGHILWVKEQPEYYDKVEEKTQLTYRQMFDYLGESGVGYFWHISDLVIYDKPRELSEFYILKKCGSCKSGYESTACIYDEDCKVPVLIRRPPQSWCYVEGEI